MAQEFQCNVPAKPDWAKYSGQYATTFNATAEELQKNGDLKVPLEFDVATQEVRARDKSRYTREDVCKIQEELEKRRQNVSFVAHRQFTVLPSPTFGRQRLGIANAAEQKWLEKVSPGLQEISLTIFGRQARFDYDQLVDYATSYQLDQISAFHFARVNDVVPPKVRSQFLDRLTFDPSPYANLFPWMPEKEPYNAMLPRDISEKELEAMSKLSKQHPINLPWTVVERAEKQEIADAKKKLRKNEESLVVGKNDSVETQWTVKVDDKWYRVTEMTQHPRFKELFQQAATILRENADIRENGSTLDPEFRAYTLTMAKTFETGDWVGLLKADLAQTKGNLFLTFFPHESYWRDNKKNPITFEAGILQPFDLGKKAVIFQQLEDHVAEIAKRHGLPYTPRQLNLADASTGAVLVWLYANGGFMRAFPNAEVLGHDYPKIEVEGITGHRNVILIDAVRVQEAAPFVNASLTKMPDKNFDGISPDTTTDFVLWHEAGHGTGARPATPTKNGKTFGTAFGDLWGAIAEPWADSNVFVSWKLQLEHNPPLMTETELEEKLWDVLEFRSGGMLPKKVALENFNVADYSHAIGTTYMTGYLIKHGAMKVEKDGSLTIPSPRKALDLLVKFHEELTVFTLTGEVGEFIKFAQGYINEIPDSVEAEANEVKLKTRDPILVDRGNRGIR